MPLINRNLFKKEFKMNLPGLFIWSLSLGGLSFLGLAFYPVLTGDGILLQMTAFFESPMMKTLLNVFGFDLTSLTSVSGFYMAYISIYFILTAALFSIMRGSLLIAREENLRTADFLLTRPISRLTVFLSKSAVLVLSIFLLNLVMTATGLGGMNLFKTPQSLVFNTPRAPRFLEAFKQNPALFRDFFGLTEEDYFRYFLTRNMDSLKDNPGALREAGIDSAAFTELTEKGLNDPENLLHEVRRNPEKFMKLFGLDEEREKEFLQELEKAETGMNALKENLKKDPSLYLAIFEATPETLMEPLKNDPEKQAELYSLFNIPDKVAQKAFVYFRVDHFLTLSVYIFLLLLFLGGLGVFISLLIKRGAPVTGITTGLTFLFYFIDRISQLVGSRFPLYLFTPFRWIDTEITRPAYGLQWERVVLLLGGTLGVFVLSYRIFRKKDILV